MKVLDEYQVPDREGDEFFKDLKGKYVEDENEERIFLNELAAAEPVVVSSKLNDGRIVLVISFLKDGPVFSGVFLGEKGKLTYLGMVTTDGQYEMFKPMIFEGPQKVFVFLGNQTNGGTGIAAYDYDVYQIESGKLISVCNIPLEGSTSEWLPYLTVDYKSEFRAVKRDFRDQLQVKVKYKFGIDVFEFTNTGGCITDKTPDSDFLLFDDELVFNYDLQYFPMGNEKNKTVFEKNCASATTELKNSTFLQDHFGKLKILAKSGTKSQKCWLQELLKDNEVKKMKDSHYRDELATILNGKI